MQNFTTKVSRFGMTLKKSGGTPAAVVRSTEDKRILISIHVKPGAKKTSITAFDEHAVHVQLAAPPVDGEANSELVRFIAEVVGVKKTFVRLDKGAKSREKAISIEGDCSLNPEQVIAKITAAIGL